MVVSWRSEIFEEKFVERERVSKQIRVLRI